MALFEIKVDEDGTIYFLGRRPREAGAEDQPGRHGGQGRDQRERGGGGLGLALDGTYVYAAGDRGFYRIEKQAMKVTPWPDGQIVALYEREPQWYPPGDKWQQYELLRQEAVDSFNPASGADDPRRFGWRGILRHPQWFYEGDHARGAAVWGDGNPSRARARSASAHLPAGCCQPR